MPETNGLSILEIWFLVCFLIVSLALLMTIIVVALSTSHKQPETKLEVNMTSKC